MKKLHLLCNAHIDPAWLWRWNEGLAETLSTFRVAADFCENYDGFVFNHNEALLYEWVEENEPELFARIQKLVKEGKWHIMGGWYLQPDCVMLSGESFLSQIELGRTYFKEKFGVTPTTAINLDPFGHSRGLVQILKKNGYDSYIFMRPRASEIKGNFIWEGFDGSRILTHKLLYGYNSQKGQALQKIKDYVKDVKDTEIGLCLWGIGNHGGGPSKIDLEDINAFIKEADMEVIHSSAEEYFADVKRQGTDGLRVVKTSLIPCMIGCYTSMVRIKQAHRHLENKLALTQKAMSYASMLTDFTDDGTEIKKAQKALAFCQFHDILPGSAIKAVEEDSLQTIHYGEEIVDKLYTKAFFKLCQGQKKAKDGEIPIMVFNPHPYPITDEFEIGFMLQNQNWNEDEITRATVYDADGNALPTQNEKPDCTFNLDWIQKLSFKATLAPASVTRFDCRLRVLKKNTLPFYYVDGDHITVENSRMKASISKKTGLIERYEVDGKSYLQNTGKLEVYSDNEDPWGMNVDGFHDLDGCFELMSDEEANAFVGYPDEQISNVRVVEDGDVRTKVQAFFKYNRSTAVVEYTLPKDNAYIDVNIQMYSQEPNKMIKYRLDTDLCGTPWGETAFGEEELFDNDQESVYHKWCGIREGENALYVINNGTYGGSFTKRTVKLSLLRTPVYSAHPIYDRQIAPHDRCMDHIDMGERRFSYRITTEKNVARLAQIYNEAPRPLSFFPAGGGKALQSAVTVDNKNVILTSVKPTENGYRLTLLNFSEKASTAHVSIPSFNKELDITFGKFEYQTVEI